MRILIVGAGAVGGYFGARLMQLGADITFLERSERCQWLKKNGLVIKDVHETCTLFPTVIEPGELTNSYTDRYADNYDLIILATKAIHLDAAIADVQHLSNGVFLPLLNGFRHLDLLDQLFGKARVMAGVAQIMSMIMPDGSIESFNDMHSLTIGHRADAHKALAASFFEICTKSNFDYHYSEHIEQTLWDKWTFLASLAGMTTLLHGSIGEIAATCYGRDLCEQIYKECCAIAEKCGFGISDERQDTAIKELTKADSILTSSMLRDLRNGQKTEHDHILKDMIQRGVAHHVPCALLKLAFTHISLLQESSR